MPIQHVNLNRQFRLFKRLFQTIKNIPLQFFRPNNSQVQIGPLFRRLLNARTKHPHFAQGNTLRENALHKL